MAVHSKTTVEVGEIIANPRVVELVAPLIDDVRDHLRTHPVTYAEWHAAVGFMSQVAEAGELPLLLDVFFESTVEEAANANSLGSRGAVQGPYYVPDAPLLSAPAVLPQRLDEPGEPLVFTGRVTSTDGRPLAGAVVDVWHADANVPGTYSNFHEGQPDYNLRGRLHTDADGRFEVRTIKPAPYPIPDQGPTGRLLNMLGLHTWRPAHVHAKVAAEDHVPLTTQVYFSDGEFLDSDVVGGVKSELITALEHVAVDGDSHLLLRYDFQLAPQRDATRGL